MNIAAALRLLPRLPALRWFQRDIAVERYVVRANHEWAIFYIDEKLGAFNCQSTYGTYAYIWRSIGSATLKEFLLDLNFDYFMGKARPGYHTFDFDRSVERLRDTIRSARRYGSLTKAEARDAWDDIEGLSPDGSHEFVSYVTHSEPLMRALGGDYYDLCSQSPDGDSKQFWVIIWPEFLKQIGGKS
jgi:hypothetical protein